MASFRLCPPDFYPRPPGGGRLGFHRDVRKAVEFLSTPSGWRATGFAYRDDAQIVFLSTPSGWRATSSCKISAVVSSISIHALRVEGDAGFEMDLWAAVLFLSTPSGWRATLLLRTMLRNPKFLSTPSGWRATGKSHGRSMGIRNFYPRPPGGGRHTTGRFHTEPR